MSKRPTYGDAILWLIEHERLNWIATSVAPPDTVLMVSDLFGVSTSQILRDIKASLDSAGKK